MVDVISEIVNKPKWRPPAFAEMAELVDAQDSKSCGGNLMGVRLSLSAEAGGRVRLKIAWGQPRVGSTPTFGMWISETPCPVYFERSEKLYGVSPGTNKYLNLAILSLITYNTRDTLILTK